MTDHSGEYLGRYYLKERLGEGGMAVVYKAYDTRLERDVAVKIIRSGAFPSDELDQIFKRFEREAKSLAKLSHHNIVKVYDYGEHDGSPYLVMEYLPGGTLKNMLGKPFPWQDAVRLILPVARGVFYAHKRGILHRDIKPANVLIADDGEPMLSDFGIAKLFEADQTTALTGSGMAIGTPEYMAPEQWTGTTSPQSDLYSLGIMLYEMVTGRKPYMADTPAAILIKQATEPLPSPRKFTNDLPEALELILIKALAKEPADRYEDLQAFVHALENLHAGTPAAIPKVQNHIEETTKSSSPEPDISIPTQLSPLDDSDTVIDVEGVEPVLPDDSSSTPTSVSQASPSSRIPRKGIWLLIGGVAIVLVAWLGSSLAGTRFSSAPTELATSSHLSNQPVTASKTIAPVLSSSATIPPTQMLVSTQTATETIPPTITNTPLAEITDAKGVPMILIPAGEFTMGSTDFYDAEPINTIHLGDFYIDKFEVTNANYKACVDAGDCTPPQKTNSHSRSTYYGNPTYDDYPVIFVDWNQANAYCSWRDDSLPTEAQWEKAARGTDNRTYPWGSGIDCSRANFRDCIGDTTKVDRYETGKSPYGVYDLEGNVSEWVADWYDAYPGNTVEDSNYGTKYRVVRGGSWFSPYWFGINALSVSFRDRSAPDRVTNEIGIRCVHSLDLTSTQMETLTPEPEVTSLHTKITDAKGVSMVLVSEGEFIMGSDIGNDDEKPAHKVYLNSYFIDKYEVTNALYKACVAAGVCSAPKHSTSYTRSVYYGNSRYDDYPVIYVDWDMANSYCNWRDARLPTEAEWEKAARGTDGRIYPWGNGIDCNKANYQGCVGDTTEVGKYTGGTSPYDVYDMAGNVWEWVSDLYDAKYYETLNSGIVNPLGAQGGQAHVLRGGSWYLPSEYISTFGRGSFDPDWLKFAVDPYGFFRDNGIRCAKNVNP